MRSDQRQVPNNAGSNKMDESRGGEKNPMYWDDSMNAD